MAFIDQMRAQGFAVESVCQVLREQGVQIAARTYRAWKTPGRRHRVAGGRPAPLPAPHGPGNVLIRPYCPMTSRRGPLPRNPVGQAGSQIPATRMFGHSMQTATLPRALGHHLAVLPSCSSSRGVCEGSSVVADRVVT